MKTIVLAEKPSVGREIARVLGCYKSNKAYLEGDNYIVTWAMGHLVELASPSDYDLRYKSWNLEYLPMLPDKIKLKIIKRTSQQFKVVKSIFKREDVNNLVIATDAGREGELVARWIMIKGGWKGDFKRLWISSQTDTAIKQGFAALKPGNDYDSLFTAAQSRAEADWMIGLNITRALTCKYDTKLSAGRVQTPTLAIIIERENEINNFKPVPYWNLIALFDKFKAIWRDKNNNNRIMDQSQAEQLIDKIKNKPAVISDIKKVEKKIPPPKAYDLTELQRDANKMLDFSAKKTLQVLQFLYERHKIVTYPRTDSRYITEDIVPTLPDRLKALANTTYAKSAAKILSGGIKPGKHFVDNSKVTDHHAIIPTEQKVDTSRLNSDERSLWKLIVKRFLAVLSDPYRYNSINLTISIGGENFYANGIQIISEGWKEFCRDPENEENSDKDDISSFSLSGESGYNKGDNLVYQSIDIKKLLTKPPSRYTEGTLLSAMEHPGKFLQDKTLKDTVNKGGLGTPATRADIIEKLFSNFYIEKNGKSLLPTSKGFELIELVPDQLKSAALTAKWEMRLADIISKKEDYHAFLKDIRENTIQLVNSVKNSTAQYEPAQSAKNTCPMCKKNMLNIADKKGRKRLVCQSFSCGYEESTETNSFNSHRSGKKEKAFDRAMVKKYGSSSKQTTTLADLLNSQQ